MFTCKIAGVRWYDAGSDVNWIDYGGWWARPAGPDAPDLWFAMRFDPEEIDDDGGGYHAGVTMYEIEPSDVSPEALRSCGIDPDGCDAYGDPYPPKVWDLIRVEAAIAYGEGIVETATATQAGSGAAIRLRCAAARYMIGAFIEPGPFRIGGAW